MSNEISDRPKCPWPLILAGIAAAVLLAAAAAGLAAMYIANFNLLGWME